MTNEEFIATIVPYAKKGQTEYGVFASVTISQACWESGYGRYQGDVVQVDNNLFGIKYYGNHSPDIVVTQGSKVGDGEGYYCHYESIGDSCIDHGYFLKNNPRYTESGTFEAKNGKDQLKCIMNAGYAEDEYYEGACAIIDMYNLYQYDDGSTPEPPTPSGTNFKDKVVSLNSRRIYLMEDSLFGRMFTTNKSLFYVKNQIGSKLTVVPCDVEEKEISTEDEEGNITVTKKLIAKLTHNRYDINKSHARVKYEKIDEIQNDSSGGGDVTEPTNSSVEKAVLWAIDIANDDSHGYSQPNRWSGIDYDCSSFVLTAFHYAGFNIPLDGYTETMVTQFPNAGFEDITSQIDLTTGEGLIRGDVLLNHKTHTAIYIGNNQMVDARIDEVGGIQGEQMGDQTGEEIMVHNYNNHPWTHVFRYPK